METLSSLFQFVCLIIVQVRENEVSKRAVRVLVEKVGGKVFLYRVCWHEDRNAVADSAHVATLIWQKTL